MGYSVPPCRDRARCLFGLHRFISLSALALYHLCIDTRTCFVDGAFSKYMLLLVHLVQDLELVDWVVL